MFSSKFCNYLTQVSSQTLQLHRKCYLHTTISNRNLLKQIWNWVPNKYRPQIVQVGDPILREQSSDVPMNKIPSNELNLLIKKMTEVLRHNNCVGLAAPQIGISLRIIIMEFHEKLKKEFSSKTYQTRQMETLPLTVIINPIVAQINDKKKSFPESCESIKGYAADVERFEEIKVSGFDQHGKPINLLLKGWNARILQHEMDHLNGILYVDKMNSLTFRCSTTKKR